jgi:hypothetical protein
MERLGIYKEWTGESKSINIKLFQPFLMTTFTAFDGIEIIYLQKRLHVLVNILAMGSLV